MRILRPAQAIGDGFHKVVCPDCDGLRFVDRFVLCETCDGDGFILLRERTERLRLAFKVVLAAVIVGAAIACWIRF